MAGHLPRCPVFLFMTSNIRKLKIEEAGDLWKGIQPKIRIMGKWLEQAGFKPGQHVEIICKAPGVMEVRSIQTHGCTQ
jgi:hypothetical protein